MRSAFRPSSRPRRWGGVLALALAALPLGAAPPLGDLGLFPDQVRLRNKAIDLDGLAQKLPTRPERFAAGLLPPGPGEPLTAQEAAYLAADRLAQSDTKAALALIEEFSLELGLDPPLVEGLLAQAILSRNGEALRRIVALLGLPDPTELAVWTVQSDYPEGLRLLDDSPFDPYPVLEAAVALSNAECLDLVLPLAPFSGASPQAAAAIIGASLQKGRPLNDYVYAALLLSGYDEGLRGANLSLADLLLSQDYSPALDLGLRRRLADLLLGHGASVAATDPYYGPFLHWFSRLPGLKVQERKDMHRYLLSRGAKANERWNGLYYWEIPLSNRVRVTEKGVRLRASPNLRGTVLDTLAQGRLGTILEMGETELSLDGYTGLWYRVRLSDPREEGWIYGKYLDFVD